TGTAMYYLWFGRAVPATPDGRNAGDPLPANDSPSLFARVKGPVSVIKSFTKQHLVRVANGGPLTLELHNSVFRSADSIEKVAALVRLFILRGGHQLQLNAVNRDDLLAAQKSPDAYRNLIVRVWGWSGSFVELDKAFQDQIIQRAELVI
ncbi:MAG: glycine radical domain-containing protein, partial [Eubacteriales bacterium]|nr:glycine radical domain-containing protein [Eubacteriales bacterium]